MNTRNPPEQRYFNNPQRIFSAIQNNRLSELKELITKDNVNDFLDENLETPLHAAASWGRLEIAKWLIKLGATINSIDKLGKAPIHCADNFTRVIDYFVTSLHVDVNLPIQNEAGNTLLHCAAEIGSLHLVKLLHKLGAQHLPNKHGFFPLHYAAMNNYIELTEYFIKEMNVDIDLANTDWGGTALHHAAGEGHTKLARRLMQWGAQHIPDKDGSFPLHLAAYFNYPETIYFFVAEMKIDVNLLTNDDEKNTPLMNTTWEDAVHAAQMLKSLGAQYKNDAFDISPLHNAAAHNSLMVIKFFLEEMLIDVNSTQIESGTTALHSAVEANQMKAASLLIKKGATHQADAKGLFPLHYAALEGHSEMIRLLVVKHKISIHLPTLKIGATAYHLAASRGHLKAVQTIFSLGGQFLVNKDGENPFHYALWKNQVHVMEFFVKKAKSQRIKFDPNFPIEDMIADTTVHIAARCGHLQSLQYLHSMKTTHVQNNTGVYPIHRAATYNKPNIIEYLVKEMKVDVNLMVDSEHDSDMPLHIAATNNAFEAAEKLIALGAQHTTDHFGWFPIHDAAQAPSPRIIRLFVEKMGVNVNLRNDDGATPLELVMQSHGSDQDANETIHELLQLNATITPKCFAYTDFDQFILLFVKHQEAVKNENRVGTTQYQFENSIFLKNFKKCKTKQNRLIFLLCILTHQSQPYLVLNKLITQYEANGKSFFEAVGETNQAILDLVAKVKSYLESKNRDFLEFLNILKAWFNTKNMVESAQAFRIWDLPNDIHSCIFNFLSPGELKENPFSIFRASYSRSDSPNLSASTRAQGWANFFRKLETLPSLYAKSTISSNNKSVENKASSNNTEERSAKRLRLGG